MPTLGLWVQRMVDAVRDGVDVTVVAPVPWVPPLPLPQYYRGFRGVAASEESHGGMMVQRPRVPLLPGNRFQALESRLFLPFLRGHITRLHSERPFDLIHAHFIFPDGVIAAQLGRELGLPVVTTEHAHWIPWMNDRPSTWRRVEGVLDDIRTITAVSEAVRQGVIRLTGSRVRTEVLPNVVDERLFTIPVDGDSFDPDRILFVGAIRHVKGFDVLVEALSHLTERRPGVTLQVVGAPFYRSYRRDFEQAMALARKLRLLERIEITGSLSPEGVAEAMRRAAVVAVPSRRESFSSVTAEALACGTPVVATRCGGPEEILTKSTGVVVEPGDPTALAEALGEVMEHRSRFDAPSLRQHVVQRFGRAAARHRLLDLYSRVADRAARPSTSIPSTRSGTCRVSDLDGSR